MKHRKFGEIENVETEYVGKIINMEKRLSDIAKEDDSAAEAHDKEFELREAARTGNRG